jgi:hypothetical protein
MRNQLLGSYFEKMFQQQTRLGYDTYYSLIKVVGPSLERKNTRVRESILVQTKITMALTQLSSENSLQMCGEVYGIVKSTTSIIMREFCSTIRKHLKPLVTPKLTRYKIKKSLLVLRACMEFHIF